MSLKLAEYSTPIILIGLGMWFLLLTFVIDECPHFNDEDDCVPLDDSRTQTLLIVGGFMASLGLVSLDIVWIKMRMKK